MAEAMVKKPLNRQHLALLAVAIALLVAAPWVLPQFAQNTLVRSCSAPCNSSSPRS